MNLLTEFGQYIEQQKLFPRNARLLLALSGGLDSMVLALLLKQSGYYFEAAHANFELRGTDSEEDERFVVNYCQQHHIPVHSRRLQAAAFAKASGIGIQEAAREMRYNWFEELRQSQKLDLIVTAHHLQDQAETILHHLARGSGIRGLKGMLPKSAFLCRPLLFASKQHLHDYALEHALLWREDKSNEKDTYTRNFIRHHIIPQFNKLKPGSIENIGHTAYLMRASDHYLKLYLESLKKETVQTENNTLKIPLLHLEQMEFPEFVLYEWIYELGFNETQCGDILEAARNKRTGSRFLTPSHELLIDRQSLIIAPINHTLYHIQINEWPSVAETEDYRIEFSLENKPVFDENTFWINPEKIQLPLLLRSPETADRFTPLGMQGSMKISDFMINNKVNRLQKKHALVLACSGKILALLPYRIDHSARVVNMQGPAICIKLIKKEGADL